VKIHLSKKERAELKRDLAVFVGAFLASGVLDNGHLTTASVIAAVTTAVKVTARAVFPHPTEDT